MTDIKVRLTVTLDLDADEWVSQYGCERSEVRSDVKSYFENVIRQAVGFEDTGVRVTIK